MKAKVFSILALLLMAVVGARATPVRALIVTIKSSLTPSQFMVQ